MESPATGAPNSGWAGASIPPARTGRPAPECMVSRGMTPGMVAPISKPTKKPAM